MNNGLLSDYITVFDPRRDMRRCFIPCLVYAMVYPCIASNLVTLDTLSHWSDSVCTYTRSTFLKEKPLKLTQDGKNQATNKLVASVK